MLQELIYCNEKIIIKQNINNWKYENKNKNRKL